MPRRNRNAPSNEVKFLEPDSPQYIEGFLFKEPIGNDLIRRDVFNRQPFASRNDPTREAFQKNMVGMFRTIEFYNYFVGHPDSTNIVADDLGWRHDSVRFMLQIFIWAREHFLFNEGVVHPIPPKASPSARLLCALVDDYVKLTEAGAGPRTLALTPRCQDYVRITRKAWKKYLLDDPLAFLDACPERPPHPQASDLVAEPSVISRPSRRRSRSPADHGSRHASDRQPYRDRSSEHKGDAYRPAPKPGVEGTLLTRPG